MSNTHWNNEMFTHGRTLPLHDRFPNPEAVLDPTMAQVHLWLAQAQRDHNMISDDEMSKFETIATAKAKRCNLIYNPYTGEFRKLNSNGEYEKPTTVFMGS